MYAIIAYLETNCCKPRFALVQLGLQEGLSMGNCVSVLIMVICLSLFEEIAVSSKKPIKGIKPLVPRQSKIKVQ